MALNNDFNDFGMNRHGMENELKKLLKDFAEDPFMLNGLVRDIKERYNLYRRYRYEFDRV